MSDSKTHRLFFPRGILILFAIALAGVIYMQGTEATGDNGMSNVLSFMLILISTIVATVWFVFFSGYDRSIRFRTLGAIVAVLVVFFGVFRIDSFDGEMRPRFVTRFAEASDRGLEVPVGERDAGIDLVSTGPWDFPGFLGPDRDLTVTGIRLARDWDTQQPELLWRQPIGAGWSGFAVVNGFAITQEQRGDLEMVTAYEVETGELAWSYSRENRFESVIAGIGPRATPTIDEGIVYALTTAGVLVALDGSNGELLWEKDLPREYGMTPQQELEFIVYGRSNSPLVLDTVVVVPAGGNPAGPLVSLAAFDKKTGDKIWDGGNRQISYASPSIASVAGVEQILSVNEASVSGHYVESGEVLWEFPRPGNSAADPNNSQAVAVAPNRVFVSKGYGLGAALLELSPNPDGTMSVEEVWSNARVLRTKFSNVTVYNGHVYGLSDGILECVDLETGERVWKHGRYHHGQMLRVHDLLLVLSEEGEVYLIEASPERRDNVLGQFPALTGKTWNNFALYGPYLVVRNSEEAAVFRLPLAP